MPFNNRTVEQIFADYRGRRNAIIGALTDDIDEIFRLCDPDKESLSLYGYPNETWAVTRPEQFLPADLPEPVLGINWSRDLARDDVKWLSMVSLHSDSWLLSVAFYLGARLNRDERKHLFRLINDLPTVFEVVTDKKPITDKPNVARGSKSQGFNKSSRDGKGKSIPKFADEDDEIFCGRCSGNYSVYEFWICCDTCVRWFHGKCVKITPKMAESMDQYICPSCSMRRGKP